MAILGYENDELATILASFLTFNIVNYAGITLAPKALEGESLHPWRTMVSAVTHASFSGIC